jgi:TetR/AcrR family macrolide resistance operon transcriptional repressor
MARTPSVSDEEILEAARRVINRLGPGAFTITDVASEVGLSRAAIILRFKSTHALKVLLLNRMVDQFIEMLAQLPKTPSGDNLLIVAAFIGERASNIDERARKRGPLPSFFASYPANMEDPDLAALERRRGEALRVAVSRVMPMTTIGRKAAVTAFCAHMTGSIMASLAAEDTDSRAYLVSRTRDWLRLAGIPFAEGATVGSSPSGSGKAASTSPRPRKQRSPRNSSPGKQASLPRSTA